MSQQRQGIFTSLCIGLRFLESGGKRADKEGMSINPLASLSSSYLQSILSSTLQKAGVTANASSSNALGAIDAAAQLDNSQLSPFAQLMSTLQQLQQTDPTKYQQVTQQIATNLKSAAQTAQSNGSTAAANQLNQLANDFTSALKSGQLPNVQDLAKAVGGHHYHHHSHAAPADSDSDSNASSSSSSSQSQPLSTAQTNGNNSAGLNPLSIILNTLSNAGLTGSNG
jgi:hypothetical protein